jgi:phosphate transport system permease protein
MTETVTPKAQVVDWQSAAMKARRKARYAAESRLKAYGLTAIALALGFLLFLLVSLSFTGYKAFTQTMVNVEIDFAAANIDKDKLMDADWRGLAKKSFAALVDEMPRRDQKKFQDMFTSSAAYIIRDKVIADPSLLAGKSSFAIPFADPIDQLAKGEVSRDTPEDQRRVNDKQIALFDQMAAKGLVSTPFNLGLFFSADSRFPELAGLAGAISGSFWTLAICLAISFPVGIAAAIYLEEFAPRNRFTDIIEVNINNLAAVPSVIFGLLGLAVFLGWFGLPRSAPLVGGLVLALMTLPTLIITTRNSLKSVPSSIREAALGIGASKHEAIFHHILPLAMPAVMTGTIISLARALGETAPLLLIGMNAFITSEPGGILDASTALPTQIYIWADSPERGFVARTSAAILVLLGFLIVMNGIAIYLRQRFERRW